MDGEYLFYDEDGLFVDTSGSVMLSEHLSSFKYWEIQFNISMADCRPSVMSAASIFKPGSAGKIQQLGCLDFLSYTLYADGFNVIFSFQPGIDNTVEVLCSFVTSSFITPSGTMKVFAVIGYDRVSEES